MTGSNGYKYKTIKAKAKEMGVRINDLLALAPKNDPFYCGTPRDLAMAKWFVDVWDRSGFTSGVHLRRVHYRLVSDPEAVKHDGKPYENTDTCWNYLCDAGKFARYQGLVDPYAFEDRRNPDPHVRGGAYPEDREPGVSFDYDWPDWTLPKIKLNFDLDINWRIPRPNLFGYDYHGVDDQPYHLEVWVEKTTLESDIRPVCDQLGITYLAGPGFQSITRVIGLIERVKAYGKPTVIFYISDFDPAGDAMPVAVARQIEYWSHQLDAGVNIKLKPIILTRRQVIDYDLPRVPIKSSDLRRQGFEDRRGEGAVELDALEALHPGQIAKILAEAAAPYRDRELEVRLYNAEYDANHTIDWDWDHTTSQHNDQLHDLRSKTNTICDKYRERLNDIKKELSDISQELGRELAPIEFELENLQQAVSDEMDDYDPTLPDRPEPNVNPSTDWIMFDTARDYMDQIDAYQHYKESST